MFWTLVAVLGLLAWGMSGGSVQLGTGSAMVGGRKAWITSEFSNAFILIVLTSAFYSFFASISSGLSALREGELKLEQMLHSTRLTPKEFVWGKALSYVVAFGLALAIQLFLMSFFNHVVPNPEAEQIRGPFLLSAYLRPAFVFGLPTILFFVGVSFFLGERWRRPGLVFLLPIGLLVTVFSFLWSWAPSWLDPRINRALMFVDLTGFRWLNETWLKLDRGAEFYNEAPVGLDGLIIANRCMVSVLGLLAIWAASRHLGRTVRGAQVTKLSRRAEKKLRAAQSVPVPVPPRGVPVMSREKVGFAWQVLRFARVEVALLARDPGLYLFGFFVLSQTLSNALLQLGAFQTPVLLTPGQFAMGSFNTLSLLVCLLMMLFFGEALSREETTGMEPILYGSPPTTSALLMGKALGVSALALGILLIALTAGSIVMLVQGVVTPNPLPVLLVWGLLLFPTFIAWSAFIAAVQALTGNRFAMYSIGLGVIAFTVYRQMTGQMNWVGNWMLWSTGKWSDMAVLEMDRKAILLNRAAVLTLAVLFFIIAVRAFQRRAWDSSRVVDAIRPRNLLRSFARLAPYGALPLAFGVVLWVSVLQGDAGEAGQEEAKNYWKQNSSTWRDAPQPSLEHVDLDLELDPSTGGFVVRGHYDLVNDHEEPLVEFSLTGGRHWQDVEWSLGVSAEGDRVAREPARFEPDDRSDLFVFALDEPLATGARARVGFQYSGRYPDGPTKNGEDRMEFILPSSVVLTSFSPSFVPMVGYDEGIGVDDENRAEGRVYRAGRYKEEVDPLFGGKRAFTTRIRVTAPEQFTVNSVGTRTSESTEAGRRTVEWVSDHPVRFFNVVAGLWEVQRGEGTAIYYHPAHTYNLEEMGRVLDGARHYYSEWFYPFPWGELKLSEFAAVATYAQGFATNITFSERIGFLTRPDSRTNPVRLVVAHEAAHQWWGNILTPGEGPGGNLLSEAMSHFSTILLTEQLDGEAARIELARRIEESYGDRRFVDDERPLVEVDGMRRGDTTLTYDKGGWVMWMLTNEIGRENTLAGLRQFIREWKDGPDYPLLEDMLAVLRQHAPDPDRFDQFAEQWFFDVVVPEYRLSEAGSQKAETWEESGWRSEVKIENVGSGGPSIEIALCQGERFDEEGNPLPEYREVRTTVQIGAGEAETLSLFSDFEPDRIVVDPDARVLQLRRNTAEVTL